MNTLKSTSNSITSNNIETDLLTTERRDILTTPQTEHIIKTKTSLTMKSCEFDLIPTSLLKKELPTVLDSIQSITKLSFETGHISTNLKEAILLKKLNLALTFKNYRPVSNHTFLSKIIEKFAAQQIVKDITKTGNLEAYQSAYRDNHSTEMTLPKVKSNIFNAKDNKEITCLILLNLSTAFDTINHSKLLNRLKYCFGIVDTTLKWIESFL